MVQGGDFTKFNGTGGESIYGGRFEDENLETKHDRIGLLSMANAGKDTNGSQFFITCAPAPHLDGKHVVFGRLMSGRSVLRFIENEPVDAKNHRPGLDIKVTNCGQLEESQLMQKSEFEELQKWNKKRARNSGSSDSESETGRKSSSHHRREDRDRSFKKAKSSEDANRGEDANKHVSSDPPKPRVDAAGREIKGRGSVRSDPRSRDDRRYDTYDQHRRSRGNERGEGGRWKKIDEEYGGYRRGFSDRGRDYDDGYHRRGDYRDSEGDRERRTGPPGTLEEQRKREEWREQRERDFEEMAASGRMQQQRRRRESPDPFGRDLHVAPRRPRHPHNGNSGPPSPIGDNDAQPLHEQRASSADNSHRKASPTIERKSSPSASPHHSDRE